MKRTLQIYISDVYISKSYVAYFKSKSFPPFPSSRSLTILQEKELTQCLKLTKMSYLNDQKYSYVDFWCKKYSELQNSFLIENCNFW